MELIKLLFPYYIYIRRISCAVIQSWSNVAKAIFNGSYSRVLQAT